MADEQAGGLAPHIDVTLGGRTWDLKPTYGALVRVEAHLGAGIGAILMRFLGRQAGVTETTRVVYEGIVAGHGNAAPEYEQVGAWIVEMGIEQVAPAAIDLLTAALRGLDRFAAERSDEAPPPQPDPTPPQGASPGAGSKGSRSRSASNPRSGAA